MGINASKVANTATKFTPIPVGNYPARLVQVVDLGLQNIPAFKGEAKPPAQQIQLVYELVDEFMKDEDGDDDTNKPRWQGEIIQFHHIGAKKAKSTARYNVLDPTGKFGGDFTKCLGTPVMVTITHSPNNKTGGVYVNVAAIAAMREKDAKNCPALKNDTLAFDLDAPTVEGFEKLPKFIKEKIQANLNYEGSLLQKLLSTTGEAETAAPPKDEGKKDLDNPF